jgi:mRNA interferase MazF
VLKRGTIVKAVLSNDSGKPRPALVIQSDLFAEHPSTAVLPITTDLEDAPLVRVRMQPSTTNGLRKVSDVMVDKIQSLPLRRIEAEIGIADAETLDSVVMALALFVGM